MGFGITSLFSIICTLVIAIAAALLLLLFMPSSEDNLTKSIPTMPIPNKTSFSALVVGATGATGRALVRELLRSGKWASVTTIGRREFQYLPSPTEEQTRKLKQVIVDFDHLENNKDAIQGHDSVFICLGTTIKAAGSQEAFRKVDYEYVMNVARLVAPPPPQPQQQQQNKADTNPNYTIDIHPNDKVPKFLKKYENKTFAEMAADPRAEKYLGK
eukprot:GEZU01011759.1.p1 GENE.GEZU01011759.1~~GEZU01011759.1.p1  ORF type:complete len:215 (+),score=66.84 GEZU01011759.1:67-711(+)